jgi:hypothetical protein
MISVCFAAKGGTGTTVVVASMGLGARRPTWLIDAAGDLPAVLGVAEPDGPGLLDWLRSDAPPNRLDALAPEVSADIRLLPRGTPGPAPADRWAALAAWLADRRTDAVVDAGMSPPAELVAVADRTLLVTRACYLALRAAVRQHTPATGVVLVAEPGRALGAGDIEAALGLPVVATVLVDPAVARAVDAGLLASRLPGGMRRAMRAAA